MWVSNPDGSYIYVDLSTGETFTADEAQANFGVTPPSGGGSTTTSGGSTFSGGGVQSPDAQDRNAPITNTGTVGGVSSNTGVSGPAIGGVPVSQIQRIISQNQLPNGDIAYTLLVNGKQQTVVEPKPLPSTGGGGGYSASAAVSRQNFLDNLAYQQQQDAATAAFNQQKLAQDSAQFGQNLDYQKGNTLLGLGSRPDTLIKYLYAIRGLQVPQQIQGTTTNLPGFQNIMPATNYGAGGGASSGGVALPAGGQTEDPRVTAVKQAIATQNGPALAGMVAPGGTNITTTDPRLTGSVPMTDTNRATFGAQDALIAGGRQPLFYSNGVAIFGNGGSSTPPLPSSAPAPTPTPTTTTAPAPAPTAPTSSSTSTGYVSPYQGLSGFNTDGTLRLAANDPDAAALMAKYPGQYRVGFAAGGVIPEPVVGMGLHSGQMYSFGERGPEAVVPNNMMPPQMQMPHPGTGMNGYATGGTIGYDPSVFNPSALPGVVQRGYNSTPDVPLLPQVGLATGGTSLVPSAQRLNNLLPSEQQAYSGALQDEFGVVPQDVFSLAQKLAPKVSGLTTPRYS